MASPSNSSGILESNAVSTGNNVGSGTSVGAASLTSLSASSRTWLHQDNEILGLGVCYTVKYVGCLEVLTSMKSLDFETRTLIAKECIVRVSESAGFRSPDRKRKTDRRLHRVLADMPIMEHAGKLNSIMFSHILALLGQTCAFGSTHPLYRLRTSRRISTWHHIRCQTSASHPVLTACGEQDTLDFVAYVGKDARQSRACFVLECGGGLAQEVIATIGQAFELRFRELMRRSPVVLGNNCVGAAAEASSGTPAPFIPLPPRDPDYYNDLPGKTPPEHQQPSEAAYKTNNNVLSALPAYSSVAGGASSPNNNTSSKSNVDNLIDFENPDPTPDHTAPEPNHEYVNQPIINTTLDVFDMRPMDQVLPPTTPVPMQQQHHAEGQSQFQVLPTPTTGQQQQHEIPHNTCPESGDAGPPDSSQTPPPEVVATIEQHLLLEPWYHGSISRAESEKLLERDGDFLVRESRGQRGQFVLTGLQAGQGRHLLLIDPHGVVRTKDRTFSSISHLIHFHRDNQLPILSADSALLLVRPVMHSERFSGSGGSALDSLATSSAISSAVYSSKQY
ncbi:SHC-transforming protein 1-like [Tropilaelaps mercedesae]|uniref:SHC-transforming protein 1-like n=1 Tax=Tropilaelaps mercedesae TaxID=418985 RepID=A0A1V9XW00_9ACAR|nr:SHC-transforming protein 1-like [Tropilaelaps mercedesae]